MIDLLWFRARKAYCGRQAFDAGMCLARYLDRQIPVEIELSRKWTHELASGEMDWEDVRRAARCLERPKAGQRVGSILAESQ
jgi:hypothetical protein